MSTSSGSSRGSVPPAGNSGSPLVFVGRHRPLTPGPPLPGEPVSDEWQNWSSHKQHAEQCRCTWKNGGVPCTYRADTRQVKRHIESVHLRIKTKVCEYCGKPFAQQANLNTHRNIHKGSTPFVCGYESCGLTFPDKAACIHHMQRAHAYVGN
ncbi:hypothetical protein EIP91_001511 [Steccherinum ochraceum]|uniref:C2H2-type domain-containing protein n=1 Tax=Steccherinum ochraceum TaxID=92696 RepID=A0A4R0RQ12_9APHY|nr:hypothetical protein EIP91_001511 [Steccherinum ochraceum]